MVLYYSSMPNFNGAIFRLHYSDVIMDPMASQITSLAIVYSTIHSDADQRKYQSSTSLASEGGGGGVHRWPAYSPHKWPVTRKIFPFDDVIMYVCIIASDIMTFHDEPISFGSISQLSLIYQVNWL